MSEICFACLGEGHMSGEAWEDCPYCDGTGWVRDMRYDECKGECEKCDLDCNSGEHLERSVADERTNITI